MKAEDLLRAFQAVETDIADAADYKTAEPAGTEDTSPDEPIEMYTGSGRQPRIYAAAGIAAAVVIGCIAYLGIAAMHNENMQAASQPEDASAVVTEMTAQTEPTGETSAKLTGELSTESTAYLQTLPPEDFVEAVVTEGQTEEADEVPLLERTRASVSALRYLGQVVGESGQDPRAELSAEGGPEPFSLVMGFQMSGYEGDVKARVVLMQDGEVIPFALTKNGTPEESHEFTLHSDPQTGVAGIDPELTQEIWLEPKHEYEYSRLYCMTCFYLSEEIEIVAGAGTSSVSLHCTDAQPAEGEPPYATASYETDYVDYPLSVTDNNSAFCGVGLGPYLDYKANVPHRYEVDNLSFFDSSFRLDELYVRMHLPEKPSDGRYVNVREVTDDVYLTVLCDGKPCKAFGGKDALRIDMPPADKSLCYPLTLDPDLVQDRVGWHHFIVFALGSSHAQHGTAETKPYSGSNYMTAPPVIHIVTADDSAE